MKKRMIIPVLALALLAAGCGNNQKTDSTSSKTSQSAKQKSSSSDKKSSSASTASSQSTASSSTTSSSAQSSSVAKPATTETKPTVSRLTSLNQQLKQALPGALLPTSYPASQTLNASYTGNASNYAVYYDTNAAALAFNTPAVGENAAAIKLQKQTFATAAAAEAQINYQAVDATNATVPVGDNLKAQQQGAAGSLYTTWLEGRWSITVQAINQNQEDGLPLAKQTTALLAKLSLPIPAGHGAVNFRVDAGGLRLNTISWRSGNALYTASGVDPTTLIQVVTSLK